MRKPIQIQVTHIPESKGSPLLVIQTVLCDDGTLWHKEIISNKWELVEPIPDTAFGQALQPKNEDKAAYWLNCLMKIAALLEIPDDQPITSAPEALEKELANSKLYLESWISAKNLVGTMSDQIEAMKAESAALRKQVEELKLAYQYQINLNLKNGNQDERQTSVSGSFRRRSRGVRRVVRARLLREP